VARSKGGTNQNVESESRAKSSELEIWNLWKCCRTRSRHSHSHFILFHFDSLIPGPRKNKNKNERHSSKLN